MNFFRLIVSQSIDIAAFTFARWAYQLIQALTADLAEMVEYGCNIRLCTPVNFGGHVSTDPVLSKAQHPWFSWSRSSAEPEELSPSFSIEPAHVFETQFFEFDAFVACSSFGAGQTRQKIYLTTSAY